MPQMKGVSVGGESARTFAELGMHMRDLEESQNALETALSFPPPRSERESSLRSHLISSGVIAYWRCFPTRDGKPNLGDVVVMPHQLEPAHVRSKKWRDQVVAHNDSATRRSLALVLLKKDESGITAGLASALSIEISVPDSEVEAFLRLVTAMMTMAEEAMTAAADRLIAELSPEECERLWHRADNNERVGESVLEWDPVKKRLSSFVRFSYPVATAE